MDGSDDSLRIERVVELTTDGVRVLHLNGDSQRALELFSEAVAVDSTYAPARYSLAQLYLDRMSDSAIMHARAAYLSDTTNHWYLGQYAQSIVTKGDYDTARVLFEQLIKLRPLDLNSYRILALLYQQQSRIGDAIALLDTAEMRAGQNPYLLAMKRDMLLATGQTERAVSETVDLVAQAPYVVENRLALAELYRDLKRDQLATLEYDAAMEIDSTRLETQMSYANFLRSRGREGDYLMMIDRVVAGDNIPADRKVSMVSELIANRELFRRQQGAISVILGSLVTAHPTDVAVVELHAKFLLSLNLVEQALEVMKDHLDDTPPQLQYYSMVVDIERYMGRLDSALYYQTRAIELFSEESSLRYSKAYLLAERGLYDESIESFKVLMNGATDSLRSSLFGVMGDISYQKILADSVGQLNVKRELKKVYSYYDKSLKIDPDNVLVLNNYAYFLSENGGDLNKALAMAERVMALEDGNSTYIDTYGWILYRLGRYEEAKVAMRRAVSLDTRNNYEIALHYGEILSVLGEDMMADVYWSRALEWGAPAEVIEQSRRQSELKRGLE